MQAQGQRLEELHPNSVQCLKRQEPVHKHVDPLSGTSCIWRGGESNHRRTSLVLGEETEKVPAVFFGKGQPRSAGRTAKPRNRRQHLAHRADPRKQATQRQFGGCTPPGPCDLESGDATTGGHS